MEFGCLSGRAGQRAAWVRSPGSSASERGYVGPALQPHLTALWLLVSRSTGMTYGRPSPGLPGRRFGKDAEGRVMGPGTHVTRLS